MKRKVILYISQSLDGFITDNKGSVDWILGNSEDYNSDYGYETFIKDIDTVILGANTYEDYPFPNDNITVAMKHCQNKKWFALLMEVISKSLIIKTFHLSPINPIVISTGQAGNSVFISLTSTKKVYQRNYKK